MLFAPNIVVEQEVIVAVIMVALYIYTLLRYQHMFNRSRVASLL